MLKTFKAKHVWVGDKRYQQWGDELLPGVTTVLSGTKKAKDKKAIQKWQASVGFEEAEKITKLACDRGSEVHACIEDYLAGKTRTCDPQWVSFWDSIRPELSKVSNIQLIEGALHHPLGFAGSVDCVGEWEGQMSIIDWKTSTKPKKSSWIDDYKMQAAAYCAAFNRMYMDDLKKLGVPLVRRAVIVVALGDRPAQVFKIEPSEIMEYWENFSKKVGEFGTAFPLPLAE